MSDVFLSYSRKDIDFMRRVRDHLTSAGISVWTDESLEAGTPAWTFAIDQAIRQARALVAIMSPDARQSIWVEKELALADTVGVPVYPILYRGTDADAVPFRLMSVQRLDARVDASRALDQLTTTLKKAFAGKSSTAASQKSANTCVVARTGEADFRRISEAIQQSPEGTVIRVRPGLYRESLILSKAIEVIGDGPRDEIVIESDSGSCIWMNTDYAVVKGLTLRLHTGGWAPATGSVDIPTGRLVMEDCDITSDSMACVAIHNVQAAPLIRRCRIHDGSDVGIYIYDNGGGVIEDCDIFGNALSGIDIKTGGNPTVRKSRIHHGKQNGILVWENGAGVIDDCDVEDNTFCGIEIRTGASPSVRQCRIKQNFLYGVYAHDQAKGTFENCNLTQNQRGAWYIDASSNITRRNNVE